MMRMRVDVVDDTSKCRIREDENVCEYNGLLVSMSC
jgi:hypothetical protein